MENRNINREELSKWFHLSVAEAAKQFGASPSMLKRICRRNGIPRWPFRKIRAIDNMLIGLERNLIQCPEESKTIQQEMRLLKRRRKHIIQNPEVVVRNKKRCWTETEISESSLVGTPGNSDHLMSPPSLQSTSMIKESSSKKSPTSAVTFDSSRISPSPPQQSPAKYLTSPMQMELTEEATAEGNTGSLIKSFPVFCLPSPHHPNQPVAHHFMPPTRTLGCESFQPAYNGESPGTLFSSPFKPPKSRIPAAMPPAASRQSSLPSLGGLMQARTVLKSFVPLDLRLPPIRLSPEEASFAFPRQIPAVPRVCAGV